MFPVCEGENTKIFVLMTTIKHKLPLFITAILCQVLLAGYAHAADEKTGSNDYTKGVWRDGKAVFSDIKLLDLFWRNKKRGYKPAQPIKYSHVAHVIKSKIECTYCHSGVNKSPYATIPSVESCMGCHKLVMTESEEIKKLKDAYEKGRPIEWVPVTNLQEHVYFTHERHIKAGVACATCHGQVHKMEEVEKVSSMKMGWCVSCHRDQGASIDCAVCHQ